MATNTARYKETPTGHTGPSYEIWGDCDILRMIEDPGYGYYFFDDFLDCMQDPTTAKIYGKYYCLDTGDCTLTAGAVVGGVMQLFCTTDNEDAGIMLGHGSAPFVIPAASSSGKKLWFECRVKKSVITDAYAGFFVGLADESALAANFIADAGNDFGDNDLLGFWNDETDDSVGSHVHVVTQKTGAAFDTVIDTAATLVADTYVKLGFKYDPEAASNRRITFFVDGADCGTYIGEASADSTCYITDTTNFPGGEEMAPIFYINAASANDVTVSMDWWRCAQLR